ncbi:MAG TPA: GGDEF and EAL domain-containing protein [Stellaceae bacterium]|nr:GGDEF and EAL domain-containing protein [Stellaceae bacterium]
MSAEEDRNPDPAAVAVEAVGDVAYAWDLESDELDWSGPVDTVGFGTVPETGSAFTRHILPEDLVHRQRLLAAHLRGTGGFVCEYRLRDRDGALRWIEERGKAAPDFGEPRRMSGVLRAVGDRRIRESRLLRLVNYDELTGHFNRTRLREAVDRAIADSQRSEVPAAFLCVGVDNMAAINTSYGREAGNAVLIEIGRRLDLCVRVTDVVGRLGGDRFGVLVAQCTAEDARVTGERILMAVRSSPVETAPGPVAVTVSVGGASCRDHGTTSQQVITRAEAALAEAKGAERDCYAHYRLSAVQREERQRSEAIGRNVQRALVQDRLFFAFQPVVSAATGNVDYYECLLRMRETDGRAVAAEEFVAAVEQAGLIRLIDRHALNKAVVELEGDPEVRLGCNVSGLTAADRPWLRALMSQLRKRPDFASRLVVEITETAALYDIEGAIHFVSALRECGCRVALDDFGAGHTSLRHLQNLAVDTVKIDRSFIRNLASSPENRVFLRHLLGLAKGFGLATVAEGVENPEDAAILRAEGIGYLQGYHIGRPSFERPWLAEAATASPAARRRSAAL